MDNTRPRKLREKSGSVKDRIDRGKKTEEEMDVAYKRIIL